MLERRRFIVVSNREPFVHDRRDGQITCQMPAGGLTSALQPVLSAVNDAVWVAHGSGTADREMVDGHGHLKISTTRGSYTLRRVWIPDELGRLYYSGLANRGLWPLCHNAFQKPRFSASEWDSYREVNALFAEAVLEEAAGEPATVFVQDYHLALLPRILKSRNPRLTVAQFWHIPWPGAGVFSVFPWKRELLEGMLGNDLLAFHLDQYSKNFLDAVEQTLGEFADRRDGCVASDSGATLVRDFPIGIDFEKHCQIAGSAKTSAAIDRWKLRVGPDVRVGIGIDRIDYTKGIPERIRALGVFLERHPEWREKLVFIQVGVPSRTAVPEYSQLRQEIENEIAAVNRRWGTSRWQPIHFVARNLPLEEMSALHQIAAFCLITSLEDGMNLVAKEFIASRTDLDGVLVLSRFAGASRELTSAVLVNPFCEDEIADGISTALKLTLAERRARMSRMRSAVRRNSIYDWAAGILSTLARISAFEPSAVAGLAEAS